MTRILFGIAIIAIGVSALTGISFFKFIIGGLLIVIGIRIISGHKYHVCGVCKSSGSEDFINESMVFGPINKTYVTSNFKGGKIAMVFSGGDLDLSQLKTNEKNLEIKVDLVFGGAKIIVPKNWKIVIDSKSIFGGFENRTTTLEGDVTLTIKGSAVFGGLEIVN